jgi:membrane protein
MLEKQNLVKRTDNDEFVLARNLDQVDFWSFYTQLPYPLPRRQDMGNIHPDDVWMQKLGPALIETDDYLSAKLAIPLSKILEEK